MTERERNLVDIYRKEFFLTIYFLFTKRRRQGNEEIQTAGILQSDVRRL